MPDHCECCSGTGWYPIYNCHGHEVMQIKCPACDGDGSSTVRRRSRPKIENRNKNRNDHGMPRLS